MTQTHELIVVWGLIISYYLIQAHLHVHPHLLCDLCHHYFVSSPSCSLFPFGFCSIISVGTDVKIVPCLIMNTNSLVLLRIHANNEKWIIRDQFSDITVLLWNNFFNASTLTLFLQHPHHILVRGQSSILGQEHIFQ